MSDEMQLQLNFVDSQAISFNVKSNIRFIVLRTSITYKFNSISQLYSNLQIRKAVSKWVF